MTTQWTRGDTARHLVRPALLLAAALVLCTAPVGAQIQAAVPADAKPAWNKGIVPIGPESYWNAVECGKQKGQSPACVFWDTGLCKNDDFVLAMYTPYKSVAYEVWRVVRQGKEAPTPNYMQAQQTRVTIGVTPAKGSKNAIKSVVVKRGGKLIQPTAQTSAPGDSRFTFDFPAFAATSGITIDLVGSTSTVSCQVEQAVLSLFR